MSNVQSLGSLGYDFSLKVRLWQWLPCLAKTLDIGLWTLDFFGYDACKLWRVLKKDSERGVR